MINEPIASALVAVGLFAITFLIARGFAVAVLRYEPAAGRTLAVSQFLWNALLGAAGVSGVVVVRLLNAEAVLPRPAALLGNVLVVLAVVVGAELSRAAGSSPVRENRPIPGQFRRRYLVGLAVLVVPLALLVELAALDILPAVVYWIPLVGAVLWAGPYQLLVLPLANFGSSRARQPTSAERERLENCFERFDERVPAVLTVGSDELSPPSLAVLGRGDLSTLFVTEQFLQDADDDALAIALAQASRKNRAGFHRLLTAHGGLNVLMGVCLIYAVVSLPVYAAPTLLVGFLYLAFACFLGRWTVHWQARAATYEADASVSESFGSQTVREAYGRIGDTLAQLNTEAAEEESHLQNPAEPTVPERIQAISGNRPTPSDITLPAGRLPWLIGLFSILGAVCLSLVPLLAAPSGVDIALIFGPLAGLSLCLFLDTRAMHRDHGWPESQLNYVLGALVPVLGPIVGGWYLLNRQTTARGLDAGGRPSEGPRPEHTAAQREG